MSAVREFMTTDAQCIRENQSLADAGRMMLDLDCGSLPICGDDGKLTGMITDRDIVLKCVAVGRDPREMMARDLATGRPYWIDADANVDADACAILDDRRLVDIAHRTATRPRSAR